MQLLKSKNKLLGGIFNGKNFSILGDSISTFGGYSNDSTNTNSTIGGNAIHYTATNNNGIYSVNDTWWKQVADTTGMNVLVNNSYSGDTVISKGQTRCEQLHDDTGTNAGTNPDVIAVYLGINDFITNVDKDTFRNGYNTMISKMVEKYSSADVYLFTLLPNGAYSRSESELIEFNNIIKAIAEEYGCTVVDLYANSGITTENMSTYSNDTNYVHPNTLGMDKITDCFFDVLYNKYVVNAN